MFTVKYRPTRLGDFVGNKNVIQPFIQWLLEWDENNKKTKCALISGVNGVGKSLLVELMLKKHDCNVIHLSIDEDRDKETINKTIRPLLTTKKTIDGQDNALVVSDIDSSSGDYGFIACLTECIKETQIPIICICDDRYSQNIKPILNYCFDIKLAKPKYDDVYALIYKVVTTEHIKISKSSVDKLYEQANGDIRFILNTLQLGIMKGGDASSKNIQSANIFDTTGQLFSQENSMDEKVKYYWMSHDIHTLMVHENYISNVLNGGGDEVKRLENIVYAADSLSDGDVLDAVFNFELAPYVALNTIKATTRCSKRGFAKFPQFLGRISTMNKNKREQMKYEDVKFFEKAKATKATKATVKAKATKAKK